MRRVVADNDVRGAAQALRRVLFSPTWRPLTDEFGLEFIELEDLGLAADATDEQVWLACQAAEAVLITANRAADAGGLESVIKQQGRKSSLPVITLADADRVVFDRGYATDAALRLLEHLENIEVLRGTGRLYIP